MTRIIVCLILSIMTAVPSYAALSTLTGAGAQGNSTTITTGSVNTTTATLIVCAITKDSGAAFAGTPVTDSKGNTYTQSVAQGTSHAHYRAENPTVGTGHTFTLNMSGTGIGSIACLPIVGPPSASTLDQTAQNDDGGPTTTHQSPSATTTQADEILIGSFESGASTETPVAAGSYTCVYCQPGSGSTALIGMAYRIVSATGNYTSHFTTAGSVWGGNALSTYKDAAGGGGGGGANFYYKRRIQ